MADVIFPDGMSFFEPHKNAPPYIKGRIAVNMNKFVEFGNKYKDHRGWINIDIKESKKGGHYLQLDTYVPAQKEAPKDPTEPTPSELRAWEKEKVETEELPEIPF